MDPTESATLVRDSFTSEPLPNIRQLLPEAFTLTEDDVKKYTKKSPSKIKHSRETNLPAVYVDKMSFDNLQKKKDMFQGRNFVMARNKVNPFEYLGKSIFMDRAGLKIAAVDAMYNFSLHENGYQNLQTGGPFRFADIAGGPGAFTQYLQWRRPQSMGYGITLRGSNDWNMEKLDPSRFQPYYGTNGVTDSGNLYEHWRDFSEFVLQREGSGVYLVVGDGGLDVDRPGDYERQEFLSSRLLLVQVGTGIQCCAPGATFMCKIFDTVTEMSAQTLFLCALAFEKISIIKPVSSRPANAERYLVCEGRRSNVGEVVRIIDAANKAYPNRIASVDRQPKNVVSFLDYPLPESFVEWLTEQNNWSVQRQHKYADLIIQVMNGKRVDVPEQDTHKCFILWNVPT